LNFFGLGSGIWFKGYFAWRIKREDSSNEEGVERVTELIAEELWSARGLIGPRVQSFHESRICQSWGRKRGFGYKVEMLLVGIY